MALVALIATSAPPLHAQSAAANAAGAVQDMTDGEIRKIDKEGGKLTIKHGEIKNLDMPPMTMVFRVSEPGLLDKAKVGDKVRFVVEKQAAGYTVTVLQPAP